LVRGSTSKPERRQECFQPAQLQLGSTTASRPESPCRQPRVIEIIHCAPATPGRHTTAKNPGALNPSTANQTTKYTKTTISLLYFLLKCSTMQKSYPPFLRQKGCKSDLPYCTGHAACKKLRESLLARRRHSCLREHSIQTQSAVHTPSAF
jgi:hypothetical protein